MKLFPIRDLAMILSLAVASTGVLAQETTTTEPEFTTAAAASPSSEETVEVTSNSYEVRNQFIGLLRNQPPELGRVLALDPTLMSNGEYLSAYPAISRFLDSHPEIRHNPQFYLVEFVPHRQTGLDDVLEVLSIFAVFGLIAFALAWLVRTVIEQKRWNRLSSTQAEVHNKILDRFTTNDELLSYIRTPAGTKFLESAPIPLQSEQTSSSAPISRILWSVQLGVIVAAGAIGMLFVSSRFEPETAQGFFALGAIALCVGAGFIVSAFISVLVSRRLGLWDSSGVQGSNVSADSDFVR